MGLLMQDLINQAYFLGVKLAMARFGPTEVVGDPEGHDVNKDRRRYKEEPDGEFRMADTKRITRQPQTNQFGNDHTTRTYPSVGGNLQDDFTGKKSRSGRFTKSPQVARTFLP